MSYRIQSVGRAHAKILSGLHHDCFPKGWSHLEFESFFERTGVFSLLAYQGSVPVGFIICWLIEDQCDLLSMGVLPDHRRDGVGLMLLLQALDTAKHMGASEMVLEVNVNNKAAQTLYEMHGFEAFATRKDYYTGADGKPVDAVCMKKKLN